MTFPFVRPLKELVAGPEAEKKGGDLNIACIAITHNATFLSRNTVDFALVPGLRFENWLD